MPAVLMEHGGEGGGQRRLLGASRAPEGRRPVLRPHGGPGRHPPRCPAPHSGAAAALEARTSSDQGSREGVRPGMGRCLGCREGYVDARQCILQVRVPGLCGCCAGEVLAHGLSMCVALHLSLSPMQSWAPASLDPPHSPAPEVPKRAAGGPPAHCQQAARAAPPPVAACLSPSCSEVLPTHSDTRGGTNF